VTRLASATAPGWARWSRAGGERPWTIGLEEELMLLEPVGWSLANRVEDVLCELPMALAGSVAPETHACAAELKTRPHATAVEAVAELRALRRALAVTLERLGLSAAVAGTHPSAVWSDVEISDTPRYRGVYDSMRELARREPTFALHVHVAVPDADAAVRALDGLRSELPLLLALSANSPFWQGRDTGMASARIPLFSMFPRTGIARAFGSYAGFVAGVDSLIRAGAIPDVSHLWWDARLQPRLGTVEVRVLDAQTDTAAVAALAALVQCRVRLHAQRDTIAVPAWDPTPEVVAENRFLAARDGIDATFVGAGGPRPARTAAAALIRASRPAAEALGCASQLASLEALVEMPGHARQRAIAEESGLSGLTAVLARRSCGTRAALAARPA
jgi:carboxylate-amine ligase